MTTIDQTPENRPYFGALIRVVAASWPHRDEGAEDTVVEAIQEMLRLRKGNAALREIVQMVAADNGPLVQDSEFSHWSCGLCDGDGDWRPETEDAGRSSFAHTSDCPVTKIRVLLAEETATKR